MSEFVYEPLKSWISFPYRPMVLLDISPICFQNQTFWGFIAPVQVSKVEVPDVGHKLLTPQGEMPQIWDPSWRWVTRLGVLFLAGPCLCLPHLSQYDPFILHCGVPIQLVLRSFSEQTVTYVDVYFLSMGGDEFTIILCHHLQLPPPTGCLFWNSY